MEQQTTPELIQQSEQLLNEWKVLESLLSDLDLVNEPDRQTKKKAKKLLRRLWKLRFNVWDAKSYMNDYLDGDNPCMEKIYDELDVVCNQLDKYIELLDELLVVDKLLGDMRQSQMLGQQPIHNYPENLFDSEVRRAIATSKETNPIFLTIGMSIWIFVSYMFGPVIMFGVFDDILPYSIFGSYDLSYLIALIGGGVCGILCFIAPMIFMRKSNTKRAEFAKYQYAQSTIFRAKIIKVVQETPTNFYVHFEDDQGKKQIRQISEETRRTLCKNGGAKYVHVLKYPRYEGGYDYMILTATDFKNYSSIENVD